jgi:putative tryptophan/tyrosine transport system substrate-binding protein
VTTRRRFLIALGAGVFAGPRSSFLYFGSRQSSLDSGRYNAFVQGMRALGYVEGTNVTIEARFADGNNERLPALAAELVHLKVDVIVASGTPTLRALQHVTTIIPVVSTVTGDPIGDGFAASLARPGGNITGLSIGAADLGPKLLELLKAVVPKLSRVAVLLQPENSAHPPRLKRIMSARAKCRHSACAGGGEHGTGNRARIRHDDEETRQCRYYFS